MTFALQHGSLQWLVHLLFGSLAILAGASVLISWALLPAFIAAQAQAGRWLIDDVRAKRVRRPLLVAALGHAPGLGLAAVSLASFAGIGGPHPMTMVYLEWWTAAYGPALAQVPAVSERNLYLWITLLIPAVEWWLLARAGDGALPQPDQPSAPRPTQATG